MQFRLLRSTCLLVLTALCCGGCGGSNGPELGRVYGRVTLAGKPLPNASITFIPTDGRPAYGMTDTDGKYELLFAQGAQGAVVGSHTVRISTGRGANDASGQPPIREIVPAKYNAQTELARDVKTGRNQIDFVLDASGEIAQPAPDND